MCVGGLWLCSRHMFDRDMLDNKLRKWKCSIPVIAELTSLILIWDYWSANIFKHKANHRNIYKAHFHWIFLRLSFMLQANHIDSGECLASLLYHSLFFRKHLNQFETDCQWKCWWVVNTSVVVWLSVGNITSECICAVSISTNRFSGK